FVFMPLLLITWSAHTLVHDISQQAYIHATFAATNLVMTAYACIALIGIRTIGIDLAANIRDFIYRPVTAAPREPEAPHWATALYVGSSVPEEIAQKGPLAVALAARDRLENGRQLLLDGELRDLDPLLTK
ncbi:MAG: hypothetical protein QOF51_887, partial [Chloroflexota bacterium]|nr:hypothetical protein [Chloroflexota bacterium]